MKKTFLPLTALFAALAFFSLSSCEKKTPAEEAADDVSDALKDGADEVGDAIEESAE